ncbi:MAG: hypothetical protein Q7W02_02295 [Candidatus Rokubacteria bacterium]|nr:hypothetical protein [Candidatus Rokubacteria bacterium]
MIVDQEYAGWDLGRKRDLTSEVRVKRVAPRRPEAMDHLIVSSLRVWDPKAAPGGEVDFAEVRAALAATAAECPQLEAVWIDEGAEAAAVLPFCRAHPVLSLKTHGFKASVEANIQIWSALAARLHARTLSIPRHDRLVAELRNLRLEAFALGSRWRVVDSSRQFHRDVSFSLALAVWAAGETSAYAACDIGADVLGPPTLRPQREPAAPAGPKQPLFAQLAPLGPDDDRGAPLDPEWVENARRFHPRRGAPGFWR